MAADADTDLSAKPRRKHKSWTERGRKETRRDVEAQREAPAGPGNQEGAKGAGACRVRAHDTARGPLHYHRHPCPCAQAPRLEQRDSPHHEQGLPAPPPPGAAQAAEGAGGYAPLALLAAGAAEKLAELEAEADGAADWGGEEPAPLALPAPVEQAPAAGADALEAQRAALEADRAAFEAEKAQLQAQLQAQQEALREQEEKLQQGRAALATRMARAPRAARRARSVAPCARGASQQC